MELERHECPIAGAAAFDSPGGSSESAWPAAASGNGLHPRPVCSASRFAASAIVIGLASRQPLPVFEADFELDPDRERMRAQRIVIE